MRVLTRRWAVLAGAAAVLALGGCAAPTEPVSGMPPLPDLTPGEADQLIAEGLDQQWASVVSRWPDAQRPEVEVVRLISLAEWGETQAACLQGLGFEVTTTGDGGINFNVPEAQQAPLALAQYECAAKYPVDPRYTTPLTRDEIAFLYRYQTGELTECLEAAGYSVPSPPSESKFISDYLGDGPDWSPYADVVPNSDAAWQEISTTCPQVPHGFRGF